MGNMPPVLFFSLLLGFIILLPVLIGLLVRLIAPKIKEENLAGLLGIPLLLVLFLSQKDKLQSALSICFEGAGLPPVNSTTFFVLVAGAISIYMIDLFIFYIIFRTMARVGIELTDRIKASE